MRILKLTEDTRKDILQNLLKRSPNNYGEFEGRVNAIIEEVRNNRDQAVFNYTKQFDGADINAGNILVTEEEIAEAYEQVDTTLLAVIRKSLVNIKKYHEKQVQNSWFTTEDGIILGQKVTALATVGVYVPGGKAVYPSSVLMNVLPAKVAGVDRIVMCTPPGKDGKVYPSTLVAAKEAGVDEIYKVGGAQGGYMLDKDPKDISAGDILRTLEGDLTPIDCAAFTGDTSTCSGTKFCVTKTVWQRINDSVQQAVDSITLQELMEESIEIHTKYDQEERQES